MMHILKGFRADYPPLYLKWEEDGEEKQMTWYMTCCSILMSYSKTSCLSEMEYNPQTSGSALEDNICLAQFHSLATAFWYTH